MASRALSLAEEKTTHSLLWVNSPGAKSASSSLGLPQNSWGEPLCFPALHHGLGKGEGWTQGFPTALGPNQAPVRISHVFTYSSRVLSHRLIYTHRLTHIQTHSDSYTLPHTQSHTHMLTHSSYAHSHILMLTLTDSHSYSDLHTHNHS